MSLLLTLLILEVVNIPEMWMEYRIGWLAALLVVNIFLLLSFYFVARPLAWLYGESLLSTSGKEWILLMMADVFFFAYEVEAPAVYVFRVLLLDSTLLFALYSVNTHRERSWPVVTFILLLSAFNLLLHIRVFMLFQYALWRDDIFSVAYLLNAIFSLLLFMGVLVKSIRKLVVPVENVMRPNKTIDDYEIGEGEYSGLFTGHQHYGTRHGGKEARIPIAVVESS